MNYDNQNNNNNDFLHRDFFSNVKPEYNKNKDQIWDEIITHVENDKKSAPKKKHIIPLKTKIFYGIASSLIILLATGLMLRHYSTSQYCPEGKQLIINLPDGTKATLQSGTTITYYPLWWSISRKVVLSGEAYFDVVKGNKFNVLSPLGNTTVLGTSFKIIANENRYIVTCFSGSVRVTSIADMSVVLKPDYTAEIVHGEIKVSKYNERKDELSTDNNMFDFESVPLSMVIKEIEAHFNISITSDLVLRYNYTGFFSKQKSVEEVLYILCKPYGLTFVVLSDNKYHIKER